MISGLQIERVSNLDDLSKLISNCQRCELYKIKTNDVPGSGNPHAKIMFIGEAPGKEEDLRGEPFVGAAGKFLSQMIENIGLQREDVFIANTLKHRPPQNRDPKPEEIQACWPFLAKQINLVDPLLIVFLGRHALQIFFPNLAISKVHGKAFSKIFDGKKRIFLALYHPAAAFYNSGMKTILEEDFKKIPSLLAKIESEEIPTQEKLF